MLTCTACFLYSTWCNKYKINKRQTHCQFAFGINPILRCLFTKLQVSKGEDFLAENFQLFTEIMISANKTAIWIISQVRVECTHNLLITTSFTQIVKIYRGSMDPPPYFDGPGMHVLYFPWIKRIHTQSGSGAPAQN